MTGPSRALCVETRRKKTKDPVTFVHTVGREESTATSREGSDGDVLTRESQHVGM